MGLGMQPGLAASLPHPAQARDSCGGHRATTLLAGPGPSPEWGGGGIEHIPSGEGDLFYGLSLCIDGFYWPMGSSSFHKDLAQEIRPPGGRVRLPLGWGAEAGGVCLPGRAGHRVGVWCNRSTAPTGRAGAVSPQGGKPRSICPVVHGGCAPSPTPISWSYVGVPWVGS